MAQEHLAPGELTRIQPLGEALAQTASQALFKAQQLEVMRLVLPTGKTMPKHAVPGEITVQCIEGIVDFETDAGVQRMQPGDFLYLAGGQDHALTGVEDASVLVTVCLLAD